MSSVEPSPLNSEAVARFIAALPAHKASLHLTHNDHLSNYWTVAEFDQNETAMHGDASWVSEEQRQKAIALNEMWELQWYPDTPVGFYVLRGCDLWAVIAAATKGDGGHGAGA